MGRPLSIETGALYSDACPSKHLPFSVPTVLVAGGKDIDVPEDMIELFYDLHTAEDEMIQVLSNHTIIFSISAFNTPTNFSL